MHFILVHRISHEIESNATFLLEGGAVRCESCAKTDDVTNKCSRIGCLPQHKTECSGLCRTQKANHWYRWCMRHDSMCQIHYVCRVRTQHKHAFRWINYFSNYLFSMWAKEGNRSFWHCSRVPPKIKFTTRIDMCAAHAHTHTSQNVNKANCDDTQRAAFCYRTCHKSYEPMCTRQSQTKPKSFACFGVAVAVAAAWAAYHWHGTLGSASCAYKVVKRSHRTSTLTQTHITQALIERETFGWFVCIGCHQWARVAVCRQTVTRALVRLTVVRKIHNIQYFIL